MSTIPRIVMNRMYSNKPTSVTNILAPSYLSFIDSGLWNCNISICTVLGYCGKHDFLVLIWGINKENSNSSSGYLLQTVGQCDITRSQIGYCDEVEDRRILD